jgi:hypothetical protein
MIAILLAFLLSVPNTSPASHNSIDSDRIKTIRSLKKLDDFPLYRMRFYGDYDLPDYQHRPSQSQNIEEGIPAGHSSLWACTCFSAKTEQGSQVLGRNFDWKDHPALLLFTDPPNRYASVSMVDISYLGYTKRDDPDKNPGGLMQSPLLPFDGMNEKGLAIGMMALSVAQAPHDPQKQTVNSLLIIRLMLDYAKNVDEAIDIIKNFNIDFLGGPPLHYFMTDRAGKSVVVEFVDRKISVLRNNHPWDVATNFILTGLSPEVSRTSCWRYKKVWDTLENQPSMFSLSKTLSLLKDVSQPNTIWSVAYDTSSLDLHVVMGKKFDQIHKFNLRQKVSYQPQPR